MVENSRVGTWAGVWTGRGGGCLYFAFAILRCMLIEYSYWARLHLCTVYGYFESPQVYDLKSITHLVCTQLARWFFFGHQHRWCLWQAWDSKVSICLCPAVDKQVDWLSTSHFADNNYIWSWGDTATCNDFVVFTKSNTHLQFSADPPSPYSFPIPNTHSHSKLPCPTPITSVTPPTSTPTSGFPPEGDSEQSSNHLQLVAAVVPCAVLIAALAIAFVCALTCCLYREKRRRLAERPSRNSASGGVFSFDLLCLSSSKTRCGTGLSGQKETFFNHQLNYVFCLQLYVADVLLIHVTCNEP